MYETLQVNIHPADQRSKEPFAEVPAQSFPIVGDEQMSTHSVMQCSPAAVRVQLALVWGQVGEREWDILVHLRRVRIFVV